MRWGGFLGRKKDSEGEEQQSNSSNNKIEPKEMVKKSDADEDNVMGTLNIGTQYFPFDSDSTGDCAHMHIRIRIHIHIHIHILCLISHWFCTECSEFSFHIPSCTANLCFEVYIRNLPAFPLFFTMAYSCNLSDKKAAHVYTRIHIHV
jgi:hypothetical protein